MAIKLIVAVDKNFGIGYKDELLFRIKEDLQNFKKLTTGHFVVMGRKTFESLPKPLPERTNVVLTRNKDYNPCPNVVVETDIDKIINHYLGTGEQDKDLWIIGGSEIYKQFLPYVEEAHVTMIDKEAKNVDTYFPMSEVLQSFEIAHQSESIYSEKEECKLTFIVYKRVS